MDGQSGGEQEDQHRISGQSNRNWGKGKFREGTMLGSANMGREMKIEIQGDLLSRGKARNVEEVVRNCSRVILMFRKSACRKRGGGSA